MAQQGSGPPRFTPGPAPGARDRGRPDAGPAEGGGARDGDGPRDGDGLQARGGVRDGNGLQARGGVRDGDSTWYGGGHASGRRLPFGRAGAARARRARRRLRVWAVLAGGAAVIAVVIYVLLPGGAGPAPAGANGLITTYQPGEYRSVPDTCDSVSAATLGRYLPGGPTRAALPGLTGNSGNQCDWTLDHKPVYRLLQVTAQAYAPSGLASGNGSATSAAKDAYAQDLRARVHPPRDTHQPPARIAAIRGLGTVAFSAFQAITAGGDTTDRVTVVARIRNALVIVAFSGLDHASRGGYGPVSPSELAAGAAAAARNVLAKIG